MNSKFGNQNVKFPNQKSGEIWVRFVEIGRAHV